MGALRALRALRVNGSRSEALRNAGSVGERTEEVKLRFEGCRSEGSSSARGIPVQVVEEEGEDLFFVDGRPPFPHFIRKRP